MRTSALLLPIAFFFGANLSVSGQGFATLDINDVRMRVFSNGHIGTGNLSTPGFVVPADGPSTMSAAGLWFSGTTTDNQLRQAVHLYNAEKDFYPGPLTTDGSASITLEQSLAYDQVVPIRAADVQLHQAYFACLSDPECNVAADFPNGYTIPNAFYQWPAQGNVDEGQALYLAPFVDFNSDGQYDPADGDHPCVLGDMALYTIFNDKAGPHQVTGGTPIGIEVHMMPFAYTGTPALDQTVFVHYTIINRGTQTLTDFHISNFADFDLGCGDDDVIGTDVGRNMVYVANGDAVDENCLGNDGYGEQPPSFGMVVLKGPLLDPDGLDNAQTSEEFYLNGTGYADGAVDNERFGLSRSMYYLRDGISAQTDPVLNVHFRGYQRGLWKDGTVLSHGGTGHTFAPSATPTLFAFPGDTDPTGLGTNGLVQDPWFAELTGGMMDPRALANMGPKTLDPGAYNTLLVAYVFARSNEADPLASVSALQQRVDSIRAFAEEIPGMFTTGDNAPLPCTNFISGVRERRGTTEALSLFPNPVNEVLVVRTEAFAPGALMFIHDAQGQLVGQFTSTGDLTRFDVSDLGAGLYTVHVLGGEARSAGRFIKE